jgi:hypothetical protein
MNPIKIISGQVFEKLTTISKIEGVGNKWLCKCECGNEKIVSANSLKSKNTRSCGCLSKTRINRKGRFSKNNNFEELIGKKFHKLYALEFYSKDKTKRVLIKCICDCGKEVIVTTSALRSGQRKSCGCLSVENIEKLKLISFKGVGRVSGSLFSTILSSARTREIEFNITAEFIWKLFLKQNAKCAISGLDIELTEKCSDLKGNTASLDRIDSSLGYIEGNVQWVHKKINKMKNNLSDKEFIKICKQIADFNKLEK